MLLRCALTAFGLLASVVTSSAQPPTPPKPAPELKRLDAESESEMTLHPT